VEGEVYAPSDDSFLLESSLRLREGSCVLDMGTGTGIQAIKAALLGARRIIAIDINPFASRCAAKNVRLNGLAAFINVVTGDLFNSLREGILFDAILFNPPYVWTASSEYDQGWLEKAWAGGLRGRAVISRFIESIVSYLKVGGLVFILHPYRGATNTIRRLRRMGMEVSTVARKNIFFNQLIVISGLLTKSNNPR
jgi:release factor glutamine methyltransferase